MSIRIAGIYIMAALFLSAMCGTAFSDEEKSPVAENWGKSYEAVKKAQIENPDAGKCSRPVTELDGKAAERAMEGYRAGFGQGKAPQNYNINLGEISGVGQK